MDAALMMMCFSGRSVQRRFQLGRCLLYFNVLPISKARCKLRSLRLVLLANHRVLSCIDGLQHCAHAFWIVMLLLV